jgi:subtilisin family serine protease
MSLAAIVLRAMFAVIVCTMTIAVRAETTGHPANVDDVERQIMVMLRAPPVHFRPDTGYLSGYSAQAGRAARQRVAAAIAAKFNLEVIDDWPMPSLGIDCFVMQMPDDSPRGPIVAAIATDARVEWAQDMHQFHSLAHNDPLFPTQPTANLWHLAELHSITTGKNVRVAAIDSGVEVDHPDLVGRITQSRNFVDATDVVAESHGTAVTGIIAARADDDIGIVGVAPQSSLWALRACRETSADRGDAVCSSFTLAKAIQFALDQDIRVINLSLGGPRDVLLVRLLQLAIARNVIVVAASNPSLDDGGFPASMADVIAVAADGERNRVQATYFAPGRDIPAPLPGRRWGFVSGSSYATAEVSGLVALLLEINPHQSSQQVRDNLAASKVAGVASDNRKIVDACAAVSNAVGSCACECATAATFGLAAPR